MVKVFIQHDPLFFNKVKWVMNIIGQYARVTYHYVDQVVKSDISIGSEEIYDLKIDSNFFKRLEKGDTRWRSILPNGPLYQDENGNDCPIETIFYLVNCIQELNLEPSDLDQYGRFKYSASLQKHFGIVGQNFVGQLIDQLIDRFPVLNNGKGKPKFKSQFYLSHDIDILHSGWKIEAYLAAKKLDFKLFTRVLLDKLNGKPFYNNIEEIIQLESSNGIKSCYYFLPAKGKDKNGIMNADYSISDLNNLCKLVQKNGNEFGLHKSSFESSFSEEMSRFTHNVAHNRFHYLKFQTHKAWKEIEAAGLKTDASLGFAEHIGFRNSYGLPFVPFDMENDRPFSFVEIPLHVMDVTLNQYLKLNKTEAFHKIKDFISKNKQNSVIAFLWHNNELTDFINIESKNIYLELLHYMNLTGMNEKVNPEKIYEGFYSK
jgi:hypothetical protein